MGQAFSHLLTSHNCCCEINFSSLLRSPSRCQLVSTSVLVSPRSLICLPIPAAAKHLLPPCHTVWGINYLPKGWFLTSAAIIHPPNSVFSIFNSADGRVPTTTISMLYN